jgi:hypothetical protein
MSGGAAGLGLQQVWGRIRSGVEAGLGSQQVWGRSRSGVAGLGHSRSGVVSVNTSSPCFAFGTMKNPLGRNFVLIQNLISAKTYFFLFTVH